MTSYVCGECDARFETHDQVVTHHEDCEAIPDCPRCGARFETHDEHFEHVYLDGCPRPDLAIVPQDRIIIEGVHGGQRRRFV